MLYLICFVVILSPPLLLLVKSLISLGKCSKSFTEPNIKTLFVTAHPDDEAMFFGPLITTLSQHSNTIIILCLSEGNYYGRGQQRRVELQAAASVLGVDCVHIINDKELQDDLSSDWSIHRICHYIVQYVEKYNIQRIVSFDEGGVSGHPNHTSISRALRHLGNTNQELKDVQEILLLETVHLSRKYLSIFDAILVHYCSPRYYAINSTISQWWTTQVALNTHSSQMVWYRRLYSILSRYMIICTFKKITQNN